MPTRSAPWPWRGVSTARSWPNCCRKRWTPEHAYLGRCRRLPGGGQDILFPRRPARSLPLTLVANQPLRTPPSPLIRAVQVPRGFDVADAHITQHAEAGDLVITADIRWRPTCWPRSAMALSPRGERYDAGTIRERLAMRDMMEELRSSGVDIGGPPALSQADRRAFASQLDAILARAARPRNPALDSRPRVPRAGSARASSPVNWA